MRESTLGSELFDLIKSILNNWVRIWACVLLERAKDDGERDAIENVVKHEATGEGMRVLEEIHSRVSHRIGHGIV